MKTIRCIKDRFHNPKDGEELRVVRSDDKCWGEGKGETFDDWCAQHGAEPSEIWCQVVYEDESLEFYKQFYDDNYAMSLIYKNLRKHFQNMVEIVLGDSYYNLGQDVYDCDAITCEDIIEKNRRWWHFNKTKRK
jgi:hypothetical protein